MRIYDNMTNFGKGGDWPKWWEEHDDPDNFGSTCVICQRPLSALTGVPEQHGFSSGIDADAVDGSGFCVCTQCVRRVGARPHYTNTGSHDRGMMQRFSAVYRTLREEIKWQKRQAHRAVYRSGSTSTLSSLASSKTWTTSGTAKSV